MIEGFDCGAHVHFIGIGGISMSGLAEILLHWGYHVTGSDRNDSEILQELRQRGATVWVGHAAGRHSGADLVVYTAAIASDNVELCAARNDAATRVISRAQLLKRIMDCYRTSIGISGMHGKSTCTSMAATIFYLCGKDPTIHIGARLDLIGGSIHVGSENYFITETDEYKDSFLCFPPSTAVLLNVEFDHPDYFRDIDQIMRSFRTFVSMLPSHGTCHANADDPLAMELMNGAPCQKYSFGFGPGADFRAVNCVQGDGARWAFNLAINGEPVCHVRLGVPGRHNIYNALAALSVANVCGISMTDAAAALEQFTGADRRFQLVGQTTSGTPIYSDYAHHPTEVSATLETAAGITRGKLWCIYQPHTYSRTNALFDRFTTAFDAADEVVFLDIYAAREKDTGLVSSQMLCDAVNAHETHPFCSKADSFSQAAQWVRAQCGPDDVILVMGAGDVFKVIPELLG